MAARTFTSAGVNNLWSNPANWDGGASIPGNNDTVTIPVGQTCEFDVDQSGFPAGLAGLTINGTLRASTTAGSYYLKVSAAILIGATGALEAGTSLAIPYPVTCLFDVLCTATSTISTSSTGTISLYGQVLTQHYARLTAQAGIGATVLNVDRDLRGIWADGNRVRVGDNNPGVVTDVEQRVIAAGGVGASTLTLTVGLTNQKEIGSVVVVLERNVRLRSANAAIGTRIFARSGSTTGIYTLSGCQLESTIGGEPIYWTEGMVLNGCSLFGAGAGQVINQGYDHKATSCVYSTLSGVCIGSASRSSYHGCLFVGCSGIGNNLAYCTLSACEFVASDLPVAGSNNLITGLTVGGCRQGLGSTFGLKMYNSSVVGPLRAAYGCLSDPQGVVELRNCLLDADVEVSWNTAATSANREPWSLVQSFDHDQQAGSFRAWTRGGVVSSDLVTVPSGRTRSYQHVCASATYWCWHEREYSVEPGRQIRARVWLRHAAGVSAKAQLVLPEDDPLVYNGNTAEAEFDASALANDAFHESIITWTNTATYTRTIKLRFLAQAASGSAWSDFEVAFDRSAQGVHCAY